MVIKKYTMILFLFVFCLVSSSILYSCPSGCPNCWLKFNKSLATIILPFEKENRVERE